MQPLLQAIVDDDRSTIRNLLKANPDLATWRVAEARLFDSKIVHWLYVGDTALHLAAAGHRVEIVLLLLAADSDPNSTMNHRRSGPLHYAADGRLNSPDWSAKRQVETIEALLDAGAEINSPDKNGATPLHRAVRTRSAAAVKYLLEHGANATLRNKPGSTPFHLAVQNTGAGGSGEAKVKAAQGQIIRTFLDAGLSPKLKDANGKSVLDWAKSGWVREIVSEKRADAG